MNEMSPNADLHTFLRGNKAAWQFAAKGTEDYLLARLGIQNALWSSFEMATQAIEKILKSYLLFVDSTLAGSADSVRRAISTKSRGIGQLQEAGHNVEAALALAEVAGMTVTQDLRDRILRINSYYGRRYPDGNGPVSVSTEEIKQLDQTIFELWDAFKVINADYYYTSGLLGPIYGARLVETNPVPNPYVAKKFLLLVSQNQAFNLRAHDINSGIAHWLRRSGI
jgi:hypothetical protein